MEYYAFPDYRRLLETTNLRIPDSSFLEYETYSSTSTWHSGYKHIYSIDTHKRLLHTIITFNLYKKHERLQYYKHNIGSSRISIYV